MTPVQEMDAVRAGFDVAAPTYDRDFTDSIVGRLQREAVWRHLDGLFAPGQQVLDLGCGTGVDAIHLAQRGVHVHAIDLSSVMIDVLVRKASATGASARITTDVFSIEELSPERFCGPAFDGVISNFGAVNCVADLRGVAHNLAKVVRPGGTAAICVISPLCLRETLHYSLRGRFAKAVRRLRSSVPASVHQSAPFTVFYRGAREIAEAFRPYFRLASCTGIGLFVPPSYVRPRFPALLKLCARLDRVLASRPLFRSMSDHILLIFTREPLP